MWNSSIAAAAILCDIFDLTIFIYQSFVLGGRKAEEKLEGAYKVVVAKKAF